MSNSLPFNAIKVNEEYDRVYKAEDWAWYFATFLSSGIFPKPSDGLQVVAYSGMEVKVNIGYAFINGYAFRNPESKSITLDMAEGAQNRVDRVVVRWDLVLRDIYIDVIKGEPSARPVAAELTRNKEVWELAIADIYVGKGVTKIMTQNITDQRFNSAVCGIVAGTVKEIDASVLTKQFTDFFNTYSNEVLEEFNAYKQNMEVYLTQLEGIYENYVNQTEGLFQRFERQFEERYNTFENTLNNWDAEFLKAYNDFLENMQNFKTGAENDFNAWFERMKNKLSEDAAGNLQLQIDNLEGAASESWADGKTIVAENGKLRTNKIYEEPVTEESLEEYPTGEKYIDMNTYVEPGFYKIDAFDSNVVKNNFPFETGFVLIVRSGGLYNILEPNDGNVFYQEAITNNGRKYRFGNGIGTSVSWGTWRTEGEIDGYAEIINSASGRNIVFTANISAPNFNGTATKAALLSTQNVTKDANTSVVTGSTVVEEYSADGSSNLPGDGDYIVMTMCGSTNMKAASVAIAEEDGRLCTRGRSNGWKDWNRYIHESDIARKRLFNGTLDVGGGVQTLEDDITQYKTIGFFCGSGEQYYHGTMFFGYNTGVRHTIPVGKGYITVTSASPTQIEVLENTTGYALRQIWGKKV